MAEASLVYIMLHEVITCSSSDWMLDLSWDHFNLQPKNNVRVTMELEVPKGLFLGLYSSIVIVQLVFIIIFILLPNVTIVARKEGKRREEG